MVEEGLVCASCIGDVVGGAFLASVARHVEGVRGSVLDWSVCMTRCIRFKWTLRGEKDDNIVVLGLVRARHRVYNGKDKRTRHGRNSDSFQSARIFFVRGSPRRLVAEVVVIDYLRVMSRRGLWPLKSGIAGHMLIDDDQRYLYERQCLFMMFQGLPLHCRKPEVLVRGYSDRKDVRGAPDMRTMRHTSGVGTNILSRSNMVYTPL